MFPSLFDTQQSAVGIVFWPALFAADRFSGNDLYARRVVQICGNVKLPLPAAQYDLGSSSDGVAGSLSLGEGALEVNIAQINPVLYV